jgi:hypothetical protein
MPGTSNAPSGVICTQWTQRAVIAAVIAAHGATANIVTGLAWMLP